MKIMIRKTLELKLRGKSESEPPREIHGFREEGTDLVILDANGLDQKRITAGEAESWTVKGHVNIEP